MSLELVCRRVLAAKERLLAADREYRGRVVRRLRQRRACESWARESLRPAMVEARGRIDGLFGRLAGGEIHGLKGKTARRLDPLLQQASAVR